MALSTCAIQLFLHVPRSGANPIVNNTTQLPSSQGSISSQINQSSFALQAANAMNSIPFLKQLVSQKDTSDEMYFRHSVHSSNDLESLDLGEQEEDKEMEHIQPLEIMTSCQYNGILWFLPQTVKFKESIRITEISSCGQCATLECLTQYHNRKHGWVDCSKVTCTFQPPPPSQPKDCPLLNKRSKLFERIDMKVSSEVLVKLPMVGLANKAIQRKIGKTFEVAAGTYLDQLETLS